MTVCSRVPSRIGIIVSTRVISVQRTGAGRSLMRRPMGKSRSPARTRAATTRPDASRRNATRPCSAATANVSGAAGVISKRGLSVGCR
jgi:hypothetical protein